MSVDYVEATVHQRIPAKCLTDIESWLLFRVFRANRKNGYIGFGAFWDLINICDEPIFPDKELEKALSTSRQVCPELCAAVERQISKEGLITFCSIDYETIFQGIIRRNPDFLKHITIEERFGNTKRLDHEQQITLITANAIESIGTKRTYDKDAEVKNVEIVHRTGPWRPESPYIIVSEDEDKGS